MNSVNSYTLRSKSRNSDLEKQTTNSQPESTSPSKTHKEKQVEEVFKKKRRREGEVDTTTVKRKRQTTISKDTSGETTQSAEINAENKKLLKLQGKLNKLSKELLNSKKSESKSLKELKKARGTIYHLTKLAENATQELNFDKNNNKSVSSKNTSKKAQGEKPAEQINTLLKKIQENKEKKKNFAEQIEDLKRNSNFQKKAVDQLRTNEKILKDNLISALQESDSLKIQLKKEKEENVKVQESAYAYSRDAIRLHGEVNDCNQVIDRLKNKTKYLELANEVDRYKKAAEHHKKEAHRLHEDVLSRNETIYNQHLEINALKAKNNSTQVGPNPTSSENALLSASNHYQRAQIASLLEENNALKKELKTKQEIIDKVADPLAP